MGESDGPCIRFTGQISGLDLRGRGLLQHQGHTFRVPGLLAGESLDYCLESDGRITRLRVLSRHHKREPAGDPQCTFSVRCPACTLRHGHHTLETSLKSQRILSNLRREGIAGLETVECLWRAPKNDYRSRAVARPMRYNGRFQLSLVSPDGPIPLSQCPVQTTACRTVLDALEGVLDRMGIQPYDPENRQGELRHVIVDAYEGETLPGPSTRICLAFGQPPSRSIDWSLLRKVLPESASRKTSCLIVIRVCLSPLRPFIVVFLSI